MVKQLIAVSVLALSVAAAAQTFGGSAPTPVPAAPMVYADSAATAIADWTRLRQSDRYAFNDYARFLNRHSGYPGEDAMRRSAERAIPADGAYAPDVVNFFRATKPLTATGWARYAEALSAGGRSAEAAEAARSAWGGSGLSAIDESRLLGRYSSALTPAVHDTRIERLLADRQATNASRMIVYASPSRRAAFGARVALQLRQADAESRVLALGALANGDAGVLMDRALWLRANNRSVEARNLLGQFRLLTVRPYDAEKWYETLLVFAQGAAADRNWTTAYRIASQIDDAYPAGTDVSTRSVGERDDYTSLAWLAGTAALNNLNRPGDALAMFERYANGGKSAQVLTKGFYWAGRAATSMSQPERATGFFTRAAAYPELFYGQLAVERIGRSVAAPPPVAALPPSPSDIAALGSLVAATRLLGQQGRWEDQSLFVRALAEHADNPAQRAYVTNLSRQLGRQDLGVWVARSARNSGEPFFTRGGYPEARIPAAQSHLWSFAHGIIRQESSFDRAAVSHASARGMMQLMPATARETAGKIGLSTDIGRLTRDPDYNIQLGSAYLASLMNSWGNNAVLAAASYNAGSGNVRKWIREYGDPRLPGVDIVRWIENIPFSETRGYVQRVLENAVVYDAINPARARTTRPDRLSWYLNKNRPG